MDSNKNNINIDEIDIFKNLQGQQVQNKKNNSPKWKTGIIGALLAVVIKFKTMLLLLLGKLKFIFIFLKLGKVFGTLGTMFLMIWFEAVRYGWLYGVGFVLLILVHEMGHYFMAKHEGIDVGVPVFIPFVGAFISLKESPKSAFVEAKVALAGPIAGSIAALLLVPLYLLTGLPILHSLAYTGIVLNIFNLIPISPLDGGRAASAVSPKLWIGGLVLVLLSLFISFSPILVLILILGFVRIYEFWKNRGDIYYELPVSERIIISIVYFGLIVILGIAAFAIYNGI